MTIKEEIATLEAQLKLLDADVFAWELVGIDDLTKRWYLEMLRTRLASLARARVPPC